MANYRTIKSERGDQIVFEDFIYNKDKKNYYRCIHRKSCTGRGMLRDGMFEVTQDHEHPIQPELIDRR